NAVFHLLLGRVYDDKDVQERIVRRSKLDWVIVRPVILTNGPKTNAYRALADPRRWTCGGSVQNLSHFRLAERRPSLAQAVMAPLICWSCSNSMFRYRLVDHAVPAMWRSLAAARLSADSDQRCHHRVSQGRAPLSQNRK